MNFFLAILAALCVVSFEVASSKWGHIGWPRLFLYALPLHPITSYAIYRIVTTGTILDVAIYFSGSTALVRLAAAVWLGQPVNEATIVAYSLTIAALMIKIVSIMLVKGA